MSVERETRKALRRVIFWRITGAVISLPQALVRAVVALFNHIGDTLDEFEGAIFFLELDAARRYQLLTGLDLAMAAGEDSRYEYLDPERQEALREAVVEDDDDE